MDIAKILVVLAYTNVSAISLISDKKWIPSIKGLKLVSLIMVVQKMMCSKFSLCKVKKRKALENAFFLHKFYKKGKRIARNCYFKTMTSC